MAKRKTEMGLGRGLNALLGDPDLTAGGEGSVSLPISQVEPGLNQPRKRFEPEALADLAALPDEQYVALLADLAVKASRTGREQVIFSQKDRPRFGKAVVTRANEILARRVAPKLPDELTETKAGAVLDKVVTGASAVLAGTGMLTMAEETRPMAGGLILRDDKVETNCSFEVLIHLQKEDLAAEVARALFE